MRNSNLTHNKPQDTGNHRIQASSQDEVILLIHKAT